MKTNQPQKNNPPDTRLMKFDEVVSDVLDFRGRTPLKLGMAWGGSIPALSANNVKKGHIDFESECHMASEELYKKWMTKGDLKKGDVIFTMEAPLGNVAIILDNDKYLLSQRVVAFRFQKDVNGQFMYHYLLSDFFQGKLSQLSTGSTAKGINQRSLSKIKFLIPSLNEQNRIVSVLETWDKSIEKLSKKIEAKKLVKQCLMRDLLIGKRRLSGFKNKWQTVEIGELLDYEQPTKYIVNDTDYSDEHKTPVLTANKGFILGYTNETDGVYTKTPVIIFDDFTMDNKFVDFDFKVKSSAIKILTPKDESVNLRFVFERMQLINVVIGEHRRHYLSEYQYLTIDVPDIKEQNAIEKILTTADTEIKELEKKLQIIKDQKKYLLNNLITGTIRTPETLSAKPIK